MTFRRRRILALLGIAILTGLALWLTLTPEIHLSLPFGYSFDKGHADTPLGMTLGLDLQGGVHLVFQADLSGVEDPDEAMKGAMAVIERRIDFFGVTEPVIQQLGDDKILVQLPGVEEVEEAKDLIGRTALIEFRELVPDENGNLTLDVYGNLVQVEEGEGWLTAVPATGVIDGEVKELTSRYFEGDTSVGLQSLTNAPLLFFTWNDEGADLSTQITSRLVSQEWPLNRLATYEGDEPLLDEDGHPLAPIVSTVITESGQIEGLSLDEAQDLSRLLNAGRIPVPLTTVEEHDISPTLGSDALEKSTLAGAIGLGLVLLFMIAYYRLPGVLASFALVIYALLVLSIFKLWPVTLTLGGIAAFILSIGMAVDANILIFERTKEELRAGKTLAAAIEAGFNRAWPSIRDSNITTFITCGILYWFGSNFGETRIMGFALTLFIGVAVSMFTAILVSRTFLRTIIGIRLARKPSLFGAEAPQQERGG